MIQAFVERDFLASLTSLEGTDLRRYNSYCDFTVSHIAEIFYFF